MTTSKESLPQRQVVDVALAHAAMSAGRRARAGRAPAAACRATDRCRARARSRGPNSSSMRPVPVPRSSSERNGWSASAARIAASTASSATCSLRMRSHSAACCAEIGLRRGGARRRAPTASRVAVARDRSGRSGSSRVEQRARDVGAAAVLGQPEERPGALAEALDQAGFGQQLEMARDARLRLAQDVGEVGDGQLGLGQQRQHAQARLLAGGLERRVEGIETEPAVVAHVGSLGFMPDAWAASHHIKISLYR